MNRKEEIEARLAAIRSEMEDPGADLDALTEEVRNLKEELRTINETAEKRGRLRQAVAAGEGTVTRSFAQPAAEPIFGVDTEEYRTAWLKHLQGKDLNDMEQRAYTAANGAISKLVVNDIMSVVHDHAPLMERITMVYSGSKITYYVEGTNEAATDHTENAAITAEGDTMIAVELTPAEIVKLVQVSDAAQQMSIPVFNTWLARMLGEAIARKINEKIITAITNAATSAGTSVDAATVQALLGSVKGEDVAILCNRKTLYTKLLPIQDNSKSSIVKFEGANNAAYVYGVEVLPDDNVADGTVLAGDMSKAVGAMGEDITVRQAYDIDTNSHKYLGVAVFDVKIGINSAFAKIAAG